MSTRVTVWFATGLAVFAMAGCGGASDSSSEEIERLEQRVQEAEEAAANAQAAADDAVEVEPAETAEAEPAEETQLDTSDEPAEEESSDSSSGVSDCVKVPNVVGKDHQLAQDTMQAAGLYMLMEEDATGQGRMLILDRNWTTVRQRPKAGKCVSEDTEIMLYAVKDEER